MTVINKKLSNCINEIPYAKKEYLIIVNDKIGYIHTHNLTKIIDKCPECIVENYAEAMGIVSIQIKVDAKNANHLLRNTYIC